MDETQSSDAQSFFPLILFHPFIVNPSTKTKQNKKPSSIMFPGLAWSAWPEVPPHLKTADGTRLSPSGIARIASGIGAACGGASAGNWHLNFNPFVTTEPEAIENNGLGLALSDNQRHILVAHGYDKGFLVNRPPAAQPDIRPSSDWADPPLGFDSPLVDDDLSLADDDLFLADDDYGTFYEMDTAGVRQTYHRCSGDRRLGETMTHIAALYKLEVEDLMECNKDDFPDVDECTVLPRDAEVWVSIYDE